MVPRQQEKLMFIMELKRVTKKTDTTDHNTNETNIVTAQTAAYIGATRDTPQFVTSQNLHQKV